MPMLFIFLLILRGAAREGPQLHGDESRSTNKSTTTAHLVPQGLTSNTPPPWGLYFFTLAMNSNYYYWGWPPRGLVFCTFSLFFRHPSPLVFCTVFPRYSLQISRDFFFLDIENGRWRSRSQAERFAVVYSPQKGA